MDGGAGASGRGHLRTRPARIVGAASIAVAALTLASCSATSTGTGTSAAELPSGSTPAGATGSGPTGSAEPTGPTGPGAATGERRIERVGTLADFDDGDDLFAITSEAVAVTSSSKTKVRLYPLSDGGARIDASTSVSTDSTADLCGQVLVGIPPQPDGATTDDSAPETRTIVGLDARSGEVAWTAPPVDDSDQAKWRPFCVGDIVVATVAVPRGYRMLAFDAGSGTRRWAIDVPSLDDIRTTRDLILVDGAGRGDDLVAIRAADGTTAWSISGADVPDEELTLGGPDGAVTESFEDGVDHRKTIDARDGSVAFPIETDEAPFEGEDVVAGTPDHLVVVLADGTAIDADGTWSLADIDGLTGSGGPPAVAKDIRLLGNGPDGLVWVGYAGAVVLVDVVAKAVVVRVADVGSVYAAVEDVVLTDDGEIYRVR